MTITVLRETGSFEALHTTIGAWIEREWDNYNPTTVAKADLKIKYSGDTTHNWKSMKGSEYLLFNLGDTLNDESRRDSSSQIKGKSTIIYIDVFARSTVRAEAIRDKINNIILALHPTQTVTIKKSDNTSISKITRFGESEVEFRAFQITESKNQSTVQMAGELTCFWELHSA